MKSNLAKPFRVFLSLLMLGSFVIFAFGQMSQITPTPNDPDAIRIVGWIAIVVAAVTHTAMNIYNMVRGKNYEQLKEALNNYKELAESRRARLAEAEADNIRLEAENERLEEKLLRS